MKHKSLCEATSAPYLTVLVYSYMLCRTVSVFGCVDANLLFGCVVDASLLYDL